ncbi:glutathione peroxidase [Pseudorhodobacter sp. 4114]|nr:glutathione peroxidase [Pseudorhodobacter sp. 4114]
MRRRTFLRKTALNGMAVCLAATGLLAASGDMVAKAAAGGFSFASIDGGRIELDDWRGHPVLVVNTASLCGFAGQFDDLQALHDRYGARGLLVLAVPSDDFSQELADAQAVKEYCAIRFDLTLAMTDITHVRGPQAHPFYQWLAVAHGFAPGWNFNKVLLGAEGEVLGTWGASVNPTAAAITGQIEPLLR